LKLQIRYTIVVISLFALVVTGCGNKGQNSSGSPSGSAAETTQQGQAQLDYWPTKGWKSTPPEQQGMDSNTIANVVNTFKDHNLHSFVVVRNGYIVAEGYNSTSDVNKLHEQFSVTKSIVSALAGKAIAENKLKGTDTLVAEYLPQFRDDERKAKITLEQLLTMTSGLEWNNQQEASSIEMMGSPDWIQYMANKPVVTEPGTAFNYSNGVAHLLSAALQKATGQLTSDYAAKTLFAPLGITDTTWKQDPNGITIGGWGLSMTTRDLAKLGLLYLKEGTWEGHEVLPKQWIHSSISKKVAQKYADKTQGGYGYFWWIKQVGTEAPLNKEMFYAAGSGGQRIFVVPDDGLVIAVNSANDKEALMPEQFASYMVQAIKSDKPLSKNETGVSNLNSVLESMKQTSDQAGL
jgi:CubicO group peptidase (beta-lactamase class C family)